MISDLDLVIFLDRLANDSAAGWVKLTGNPKPMDVASMARKLFIGIAEDNPLVDRSAMLTKARKFWAALNEADASNRVATWHPDYWAFVEHREVFTDAVVVRPEDFPKRMEAA